MPDFLFSFFLSFFYLHSFPLLQDTIQMKKDLEIYFPVGTSVVKMEEMMKKNGFSCRMEMNSSFVEESKIIKMNRLIEKIDYLYCDLEKAKTLFISERWQIAFVLDEEKKLKEIYVSYGTTGL
ncbi:MAG TPA: hypothetical protein DHW82_12670 [Spirochaetia bacterium]|nr:MAG: hypothetical protein A2Y41_06140 [Spirochaetes bacterium GWB1_36_13]HCL57843.1 hypothetical protein [Spirochaetia bacterium]